MICSSKCSKKYRLSRLILLHKIRRVLLAARCNIKTAGFFTSTNKNFYVRTDGNDNNDGETDTPSGAWRTATYAVEYLSSNYNIGKYTAVINFGPGTWGGTITLPKYNMTTGGVRIVGSGKAITRFTSTDANIFITTENAGTWDIRDCSIILTRTPDGPSLNQSCLVTRLNSRINIQGIAARVTEAEGNTYQSALINVSPGTIGLNADCEFLVQRLGTTGNCFFMRIADGGQLTHNNDAKISGPMLRCLECVNGSKYVRNAISMPVFTSSNVSGKRYSANMNSIVNTYGGGAEFFPGSTAGGLS